MGGTIEQEARGRFQSIWKIAREQAHEGQVGTDQFRENCDRKTPELRPDFPQQVLSSPGSQGDPKVWCVESTRRGDRGHSTIFLLRRVVARRRGSRLNCLPALHLHLGLNVEPL
jgi:hypothetical protein